MKRTNKQAVELLLDALAVAKVDRWEALAERRDERAERLVEYRSGMLDGISVALGILGVDGHDQTVRTRARLVALYRESSEAKRETFPPYVASYADEEEAGGESGG